MCKQVYIPEAPKGFKTLISGRKRLTPGSDSMLKKLYDWRLDYAMVVDGKEGNIIPDHELVDMAINYQRIEAEEDLKEFYNLKPCVLKQSRKIFYILSGN